MVAAEQGNLEIIQELIRRGANVNFDDVVSKHIHLKLSHMNTPAPPLVHAMLWIYGFNCGESMRVQAQVKNKDDIAEGVALMFHLAELATLRLSPQLL